MNGQVLLRCATINEIDTLVIDQALSKSITEKLKQASVNIVVAKAT